MKTFTILFAILFLTHIGMFAQSGMTIKSGGAVTVNGNLTIIPNCPNSFIDARDGKTYNTLLIGTQCWFAQNLNVGTKIIGSADQTNNGIIEKYCYDNDDANCAVYGGLYQWDEAMTYSTSEGIQGICPTGWHLPTDAEFALLSSYLGGDAIAGGKMKETGTAHWASPNTGATNSSGFLALPNGYRYIDGTFGGLSNRSIIWSSSQQGVNSAWYRNLDYDNEILNRYNSTYKTYGLSVRCLKD